MGTQKMIVTPWVLALCVGVSLSQEVTASKDALEQDGKEGAGTSSVERNKRLFFVSTTSSTSTVVTAMTCYLTKAALVVCGKRRKKRSYLEESNDEQPTSLAEGAINPARTQPLSAADESANLAPGYNEIEAKQREGKFLLYWMTTTSVITTTSFTLTQTLASIACTPSSFVMSNCASLG